MHVLQIVPRHFFLALMLACPWSGAYAATFCVATTAELQSALTDSASNSEDDTIRLVAATFLAPPTGFSHAGISGRSLSLHGGYDIGCSTRKSGAKSTIDGQLAGATGAMRIIASNASLTITDLVFEHFAATISSVSALAVKGPGVEILVERIGAFSNTSLNGGVINIQGGAQAVTFRDSLISGNHANSAVVQIQGSGVPPAIEFTACNVFNNTHVANRGNQPGQEAAFLVNRCAQSNVASNVFWNNDGTDLALLGYSYAKFSVDYNDIERYAESANLVVSLTGNLSVDPGFEPGSFFPSQTSPLVDGGALSEPDPTHLSDYNESYRFKGGRVDIGAIEFSTLLSDGFE